MQKGHSSTESDSGKNSTGKSDGTDNEEMQGGSNLKGLAEVSERSDEITGKQPDDV
jgi:hypothetical protein